MLLVNVSAIEEPREKKLRWDQPKDVIQKILDVRQLLRGDNVDTSRKINYDK